MRTNVRPHRILLVDDEPFILTATAGLLRSAGNEVFTCDSPTGVAATMTRTRPDLILLDYNMPAIRGDELCRILKKNAANSDMKIVIFSSEPESDLRRIVAECGADSYIPKNCAGHVLMSRIKEHLPSASGF